MTRGWGALLSGVAVVVAACGDPPDPDACAPPTIERRVTQSELVGIDLLLVVDDSASMAEEQAALAAELRGLVAILATGDRDQDGDTAGDAEPGDVDFEPFVSLRLGVVTTDMGTGGVAAPTCDGSVFGGDGLLRTRSSEPGCDSAYPAVLRFDPRETVEPVDAIAGRAACMATAGTSGCGFEQSLEAMLKALSPSAPTAWTADGYVPPVFFGDTAGHGDGANADLARADSVLVIVTLTDEDDCSARDPALFDEDGPYAETPLNLRCAQHPEALHPVERYVDGLIQLRRRPQLLLFMPITGVPIDLVPPAGAPPDWDALRCDDADTCDRRLRHELDPDDDTRPRSSCTGPHGAALPPTRMIRVAHDLEERGAQVALRSVCEASFEGLFEPIFELVTSRHQPDCVSRPIARGDDESIPCTLRVLLPAGRECADYAGSEPVVEDGVPVREDGRALCAVPQIVPLDRSPDAPPPPGRGFYYDDYSAVAQLECGARVALTEPPPPGTELRLSCDAAAAGSIGGPCDPADATACEDAWPPQGGAALACDPITSTCAIPCTTDDDCAIAGVEHFICDRRPLAELDAGLDDPTPRNLCVDPTCG